MTKGSTEAPKPKTTRELAFRRLVVGCWWWIGVHVLVLLLAVTSRPCSPWCCQIATDATEDKPTLWRLEEEQHWSTLTKSAEKPKVQESRSQEAALRRNRVCLSDGDGGRADLNTPDSRPQANPRTTAPEVSSPGPQSQSRLAWQLAWPTKHHLEGQSAMILLDGASLRLGGWCRLGLRLGLRLRGEESARTRRLTAERSRTKARSVTHQRTNSSHQKFHLDMGGGRNRTFDWLVLHPIHSGTQCSQALKAPHPNLIFGCARNRIGFRRKLMTFGAGAALMAGPDFVTM